MISLKVWLTTLILNVFEGALVSVAGHMLLNMLRKV